MVVLVYFVGTFFSTDVLIAVILIVGIYIPTFYAVGDVPAAIEIVLAFKVAILDHVANNFACSYTPFWLQSQVSKAHGVNGQAVTIDKHTAVGRDGIPVGVEESVCVIECSAIGRIRHSFLADEDSLAIVESHAR